MTERSAEAKLVHDLRTPLNAISITAQLVKLKAGKGEDVGADLDKILEACQKLSKRLEEFRQESAESDARKTKDD